MHSRYLTISLSMLAGTLASPVLAQETQAPETQDTMVVVGSRTPTEISQIPGAVSLIASSCKSRSVPAPT